MSQRMAPVALLLFVSACSPTTTPDDAALPRVDASGDAAIPAFTDASIPAVDAFIVRSDAPFPPGTDAGPPGPDARMPENCETPGDEDGDRLLDCRDPDCWDGCAAAHVESELPGLVACREAVTQTPAQSLAACTPGDIGGTPTQCSETIEIASTARFFCDAADVVRAVWLDERLTFPPLAVRRLGPTSSESIRYERSITHDLARVSAPSSAGSTHAVLEYSHGVGSVADDGVRVPIRTVRVFPIAASDTSFQHLTGAARVVSIVVDLRSTDTRTFFRTGTVNLTTR